MLLPYGKTLLFAFIGFFVILTLFSLKRKVTTLTNSVDELQSRLEFVEEELEEMKNTKTSHSEHAFVEKTVAPPSAPPSAPSAPPSAPSAPSAPPIRHRSAPNSPPDASKRTPSVRDVFPIPFVADASPKGRVEELPDDVIDEATIEEELKAELEDLRNEE